MSGTKPTRRLASYQSYFDKVLAKRLRYLRNINGLIAVVISITLSIPYGRFWWRLLLTFIVRAPLIFLALVLVKLSRDRDSTVQLSPYKTSGQQILHTIVNKKIFGSVGFYAVSANIMAGVFASQLPGKYDYYVLSKIYQQKPLINDEWVYYWFYASYVAVLYTVQHLVFQRNRLRFQYGVNKVKPESVFFSRFPKLFGNSIGLNIITTISGPIVYFFIRSVIYKLNWLTILVLGLNSSIPPFGVSLKTVFNLSYLSFHIIFAWEIVNHVYHIYATIGCLDGSKLISTYSADPISTLLSGLRNIDEDHQLSRLTAFQELAYISTTKDAEGVKIRTAIYNAHFKGGFVWPAILTECALVIKETTSRVNYRSKSDLKVLQRNQNLLRDEINTNLLKTDDDIFGNSFLSTPTLHRSRAGSSNDSPHGIRRYEDLQGPTSSSSRSSVSAQLRSTFSFLLNSPLYKVLDLQLFTPIKSFFATSLDTSAPITNSSNKQSLNAIGQCIVDIKLAYSKYQNQFLSTSIGALFRVTVQNDADSRVLNPVNYGNAVITVTNLLIHAIEEDKNNTVNNSHISEVLNLLERPIRACSNYTDALPASVYLTADQQRNPMLAKKHLIALLHDLTMNEFYQLCLKYNYKLNDLVLSSRAFKLAKWVIDVAISQQQQQQQEELKSNKSSSHLRI